jgi:hypothetical protein
VAFELRDENIRWRGIFSLEGGELFRSATDGEPDLVAHIANEEVPIAEYFNEALPSFFCSDLSPIEGNSLYKVPMDIQPIGDDCFEAVDWADAAGVIEKEKPDGNAPRSIFEWLEQRLLASEATIVFCDDGSGEVADFITVTVEGGSTRVALYHCKASDSDVAGNRVADLYDVCGQAVKSSIWLRPDVLLSRLHHRVTLPSVRGFLKGAMADLQRLLALEVRQGIEFDVYIVQPGILRVGREIALSNLLSATQDYLVQGGTDRFGILCS